MYTCPGDHFRALKSEKFGIVLQKALNAVIHSIYSGSCICCCGWVGQTCIRSQAVPVTTFQCQHADSKPAPQRAQLYAHCHSITSVCTYILPGSNKHGTLTQGWWPGKVDRSNLNIRSPVLSYNTLKQWNKNLFHSPSIFLPDAQKTAKHRRKKQKLMVVECALLWRKKQLELNPC